MELPNGVYVGLSIEPTRGLKHFIDRLPPEVGEAIDPTTVHVTAVYPEEIAVHGLSTDERLKLRDVEHGIRRALGNCSIAGTVLFPDPERPQLEAFKQFAGIPIEPNDALMAVRQNASDVIFDVLGFRIPTYRGDYHMGLTRRHSRKPVPPRPAKFPAGFQVTGLINRTSHVPTPHRREHTFVNNLRRAIFSHSSHTSPLHYR